MIILRFDRSSGYFGMSPRRESPLGASNDPPNTLVAPQPSTDCRPPKKLYWSGALVGITVLWPPAGAVVSGVLACRAVNSAFHTVDKLPDPVPLGTDAATENPRAHGSEHPVGVNPDAFEVDKVNAGVHLMLSYVFPLITFVVVSFFKDKLPLNRPDEVYGNDNQRNVIATHVLLTMLGVTGAALLFLLKDAMRDQWPNIVSGKIGDKLGINPGPSAGTKELLNYQLRRSVLVESLRFTLFVAFSSCVAYVKKDTWQNFPDMLGKRRPDLPKPMTDTQFNDMLKTGLTYLLLAESFAAPRALLELMGQSADVFTLSKHIFDADWKDTHNALIGPGTFADVNNWIGILCMYFTVYNVCLAATLNQIKIMAESHAQQSSSSV